MVEQEFNDMYLKKLIATYGYDNLLNRLKKVETDMAEDVKTMFKFNIFNYNGVDFVMHENLVSFLGKLEPYVMDVELSEIELKITKIDDTTFFALDQLLLLMRSIDPNVPAFNLTEIADFILAKSENKDI